MYGIYLSMRNLWISLFMVVTVQGYAQTSLNEAIESALTKSCLDRSQTAVSVVAVPTGHVVYTQNAQTPLLPASIMKLVTTAAALHYLGPEFRFETDLLYSGERSGGILHGDLILRGGGDPKLSPADLWRMAMIVKNQGINQVEGRLIADVRFFDSLDRSPDWEPDEDEQRAYNAKIGALSVNYNVVAIHIGPGVRVGDPIAVWLEPDPGANYLPFEVSGKTRGQGRSSYSAQRIEGQADGREFIQVSGSLPVNTFERIVYITVGDPTRYALETFRMYLQQLGVQVQGSSESGSTPPQARQLYHHESPPLTLILKELNTYSNNFIAEQLVKTISAEHPDTTNNTNPTHSGTRGGGSHAEGLQLIRAFLSSNRVNLQGVNISDGSGLSRKNQFTAQAMTDLLVNMYQRFDIGPDFVSALRVMGAEGAPSKRFKNSPVAGLVRAKTGTLAGLSTLAGYVATPDNQMFAYALFLNNNRCGGGGADAVENTIVTAIHQFGSNVTPENRPQLSRATPQQ